MLFVNHSCTNSRIMHIFFLSYTTNVPIVHGSILCKPSISRVSLTEYYIIKASVIVRTSSIILILLRNWPLNYKVQEHTAFLMTVVLASRGRADGVRTGTWGFQRTVVKKGNSRALEVMGMRCGCEDCGDTSLGKCHGFP